jgi:hypothetical protein
VLDFVIDFAYSPFALNQGQKQVFALTVELFAEQESRVYSVSEITRAIKTTLEDSLPTVWIEGEISNFTHHSSGHMYFFSKRRRCANQLCDVAKPHRHFAVCPAGRDENTGTWQYSGL